MILKLSVEKLISKQSYGVWPKEGLNGNKILMNEKQQSSFQDNGGEAADEKTQFEAYEVFSELLVKYLPI